MKDEDKKDIEALLGERRKLDERLRTQFTRRITVMFTDIQGSTSYFEKFGDLEGRAMVHQHHELVLPIIERNQGALIKTIGDGTLSTYDEPVDSVRAAGQIQQALREHNSGRPANEQILVRIGLNSGLGIVEEKDVFGDVVNTASRIASLGKGGEVMAGEDVYAALRNNDEFIFRSIEDAKVKGKQSALKAYRLLWHEEDLALGRTRRAAELSTPVREGVLVLEASIAGRSVKISAYSRKDGVERAIKNYQEVPYHKDRIKEYTRGIITVMNSANQRGRISNDLLVRLKELGGLLYDQLLPAEIKDLLARTTETGLLLAIDDHLVHIPWELLHDGQDFLCRRFSMGRTVSTRQSVSVKVRALQRPLKMQILADPQGDLQAAYEEGVAIKNEVSSFGDWIDVTLRTTDIPVDLVKSKMRNFDIVHYAGHAEHKPDRPEESGWLLKDGRLSASDVLAMAGSRPMPALVFSNACQSGQTDAWKLEADYGARIFGLANAFLLSGVQHYVGTFWEIPDEAGAFFARSFYRGLVEGETIGEAMQQARQALIGQYGEEAIVWASYMLYGDPTTRYAQTVQATTGQQPMLQQQVRDGATAMRGPEPGATGKKRILSRAAALLVIAAAGAFLYFGNKHEPQLPTVVSPTASNVQGDKTGSSQNITTKEMPVQRNVPAKTGAHQDSKADTQDKASAARSKIEAKGIAYSAEGFLKVLKDGNAETAELFLSAGIDVNVRDTENGNTPLIIAIRSGNSRFAKMIIEAGALPDLRNRYGTSALVAASEERGMPEVTSLLIKAGTDIKKEGPDALFWAARWGHKEIVTQLLAAGVDLKGKEGIRALTTAADYGHTTVVATMLDQGADINGRDSAGYTPLARAAEKNKQDLVLLLITRGAAVNSRDNGGYTPMLRAGQGNHPEMVKLLIAKGADKDGKNDLGESGVLRAVRDNHPDVLTVLVESGADVNAADNKGSTALQIARQMKRQKLIDILERK